MQSSFKQGDGASKDRNINDQQTVSPIVQKDNPQGNISTLPVDQITAITSNNGIFFTFQIGVIYGSLIITRLMSNQMYYLLE